MQQITWEHPFRNVISALQLYWNHTPAWVSSCKFAAYLQNTFFEEHLWMVVSVLVKLSGASTIFLFDCNGNFVAAATWKHWQSSMHKTIYEIFLLRINLGYFVFNGICTAWKSSYKIYWKLHEENDNDFYIGNNTSIPFLKIIIELQIILRRKCKSTCRHFLVQSNKETPE